MNYLDFLKKYWKYVLVLVLIFAAFVTGRYTKKQPNVTIQEKEKIVYQDRVDEKLVQQEVDERVAAIKQELEKHTTTIVVTKKDGTKVEKTTTDIKSTKTETKIETKYVDRVVTKTEYVDRVVTKISKEEIKDSQPDWLVGLSAGASVESFKALPNIYVGLEGDRRVLGPFYVGLSAGILLNPATGQPKGGLVLLNLKATF